MRRKLTTIAFDADDTLWQNEQFFQMTQERFADLLADYVDSDELSDRLLEAEQRNLGHYGFGVKGFVLSMIETALEVTQEEVPATVISKLLEHGREMLSHPIELLPHAENCIKRLSAEHMILLITKGDLLDQERKLAQSGLGELFDGVEIVSDKTPQIYDRIFGKCEGGAASSMMVGNSLKSDVLPSIAAGAKGVFVPHELTWAYEEAEQPKADHNFHTIADLSKLPSLITQINETM